MKLVLMMIVFAVQSIAYGMGGMDISNVGEYRGIYGNGIRGVCHVQVLEVEHSSWFWGFNERPKHFVVTSNILPEEVRIDCEHYGIDGLSCRHDMENGQELHLDPRAVFYNHDHTDYKLPALYIYENNEVVRQCIELRYLNSELHQ